MKWYIKSFVGSRYLKAWTRFTRVKYTDGSPDWKYHTQILHFTHSREDAKKFDKEKSALNFCRNSPDLRKMLEAKEISLVQE